MTTTQILIKCLPICIILLACGGKSKTGYYPKPETINPQGTYSADTIAVTTEEGFVGTASTTSEKNKKQDEIMLISSISTQPYSADTSKKFIKTAKVKFKVNNMLNATYGVEDITRHFGGFISYTSLQTEIRNVEYTDISEDSLLKRTHYTVVNNIILRVPAAKLDSTLRSFTPFIDFLDYRTITCDDISLKLLANHLTQMRIKNQRLRIDKKSKPGNSSLEDVTYSEEALLNRQEQADASMIENISLMDQVKYSTIELSIYQDEKIKLETVFNTKSLKSYNNGFGFRLKRSFMNGLHGVEAIVLFIVQFWALFVIAGIAIFTVRLLLKRKK